MVSNRRAVKGTDTPTTRAAMANTTISSMSVKPRCKHRAAMTIPPALVGDVRVLSFAAGGVVGAVGDDGEVAAVLAWNAVLIRVAPGILWQLSAAQIGAVPAVDA